MYEYKGKYLECSQELGWFIKVFVVSFFFGFRILLVLGSCWVFFFMYQFFFVGQVISFIRQFLVIITVLVFIIDFLGLLFRVGYFYGLQVVQFSWY